MSSGCTSNDRTNTKHGAISHAQHSATCIPIAATFGSFERWFYVKQFRFASKENGHLKLFPRSHTVQLETSDWQRCNMKVFSLRNSAFTNAVMWPRNMPNTERLVTCSFRDDPGCRIYSKWNHCTTKSSVMQPFFIPMNNDAFCKSCRWHSLPF